MKVLLQDFLTRHRGWIVLFVALPISFLYIRAERLRGFVRRIVPASESRHRRRVERIQSRLRSARAAGQRMVTARASWKTMSPRHADYKKTHARIPIDLRDILHLDEESCILRVEPMATMGEITRWLVPKGWALAVQVEMDDITIGGLCMGVGIETTSHRAGLMQENVTAFEVVTADGELRRATANEEADLFAALPWSHGTLGFLTAVEVRVVRISRWMKLRYDPYHDRSSFVDAFARYASAPDGPAYLEALAFGPQNGVIMTGETVDAVPAGGVVNRIGRWYKPWFFSHVEKFLAEGPGEEFIPSRDYFHRHTRSIFWEIRDIIPFSNHPVYRGLCGWLGAPKVALMKRTTTRALRKRMIEKHVAQDILVPISDLGEAIERFETWFGIYPLWVCPTRLTRPDRPGFLRIPEPEPGEDHVMFVDVGAYGIPRAVRAKQPWQARTVLRAMEAWVRRVGGFQMLYADMFMSRSEFEAMFDHAGYRAARERFGAVGAFPEVFEKVRPEAWLGVQQEDAEPRDLPQESSMESALESEDSTVTTR